MTNEERWARLRGELRCPPIREGFPRGTLIPLANGPAKPIEEVDFGDKVYDGRGHPVKWGEIRRFKYDGPILEINAAYLPRFRVLPDQQLLIWPDGRWIRRLVGREQLPPEELAKPTREHRGAWSITGWDYLFYPKYKARGESPWEDYSLEDCWALGILAADGSTYHSGRVHLTQAEKNRAKFARFKAWAEEAYPGQIHLYDYEYGERKYERIAITDEVFFKLVSSNFGTSAYEKRIPSAVLDLSEGKLKEFLRGYFDGDGWTSGNKKAVGTRSYGMAFGLQLAFTRLGYMGSLTCSQKGGKPMYQLRVSGPQFLGAPKPKAENAPVWDAGDSFCVHPRSVRWLSYQGDIYCLKLGASSSTWLAPVLMAGK